MKVIIEEKKMDPEAIHKSLQRGYGIKHPEKISGYLGFFANYGTVYASDEVHRLMEVSPEFRKFVFDSYIKYQNDEYGLISERERDDNIEEKWICGGSELLGRYAYGKYRENALSGALVPECMIKIRGYQRNTYILFDAEPDWLIRNEPITGQGTSL